MSDDDTTVIGEGPIESIAKTLRGEYGYTILYSEGNYDSYAVSYIAFSEMYDAEEWLADPNNSHINPIAYIGRITAKPISVAERVKCFKIDS